MPDDADDGYIRRWGHGQCHVLTIALHRLTGWPILTLHDTWDCQGASYLSDFGYVVHSGVVAPDGRFLDIRGLHGGGAMESMKELYSDFTERLSWRHDAIPSEDDIVEILCDRDFENLDSLLGDAQDVVEIRLSDFIDGYTSTVPSV